MANLNANKKICLLTDHHISINPRLWKEAFLYERMGFDVVVLTQWISDYFLEKDRELLQGHQIRYEAYLDMRPGHSGPLTRFFYRLRKRLGGELQKQLNISRPWAVSYAPELLYGKAMQEKADIYAAHLEAGFIAGVNLVRAGKKVGFDLEDWYSRDYLTPDRAVKLLNEVEGIALRDGVYFTTTSDSLASSLRDLWKVDKPVTVIYNSFPDEQTGDIAKAEQKGQALPFRLIWTSRTIGPKRGLETLTEALRQLHEPVELHIIGQMAEGYDQVLKHDWPGEQGHTLVIHDFVRHRELQGHIAGYDLGIAVELNEPDSRNKTITNKIFQYIQAGIRVLATDTDGQKELAAHFPESIFIVPVNRPDVWAETIRRIMMNRNSEYRAKQQETYHEKFSWPAQEEKLKQLITAHI